MHNDETERRVMSGRRPQGPPPTPGNPALYAALLAIAELGSDNPAESFQKRPARLMRTGETPEQFAARRQPLEALWDAFMAPVRRQEFGA